MSEGYRGGSTSEVWSIRFQTIEAGLAAIAFVVMKIRPPLVAAQTTLLSDGDGASIETWPPERSSPNGNGPVHGVFQGPPGVDGQRASGPSVSRPALPGSPMAFQSSQTSIGRS